MTCDFSSSLPHITSCDHDDDTLIININYSKVQPDIQALTSNMENNEDTDASSEIQYLGKLEYSLDYDFQKQEVYK